MGTSHQVAQEPKYSVLILNAPLLLQQSSEHQQQRGTKPLICLQTLIWESMWPGSSAWIYRKTQQQRHGSRSGRRICSGSSAVIAERRSDTLWWMMEFSDSVTPRWLLKQRIMCSPLPAEFWSKTTKLSEKTAKTLKTKPPFHGRTTKTKLWPFPAAIVQQEISWGC